MIVVENMVAYFIANFAQCCSGVHGICLEGVQKVYRMYLGGFWEGSERCLKGHRKVSGRCSKSVWRVSGKCLESVEKVSEMYLKIVFVYLKTFRKGEPKRELNYGPAHSNLPWLVHWLCQAQFS